MPDDPGALEKVLRDALPVSEVVSLTFSRDGKFLATGGNNGLIALWDGQTLEKGLLLANHRGIVKGRSFSPDSKRLASGGADKTLRLWDVKTGQQMFLFPKFTHEVVAVAFAADGQRLAAAFGNGATVWTAP